MSSPTSDHTVGAPMNDGIRITFIIIGTLMVVSGLFGNGLLMAVLWKSKVRDFPKVFIANLALADLVVICCLPVTVLDLILGWLPISSLHCRVNADILSTGYNVSIMSLITVSFNRYVKVCRPTSFRRFFTTRRNLIICAVLWSFAILTNIPAIFPSVATYGYDPNAHTCKARGQSTAMNYGSVAMISLLISPVVLITYFNVAIYKRWHSSQLKMKKKKTGNTKSKVTKDRKIESKTKVTEKDKKTDAKARSGRDEVDRKEDATEPGREIRNRDLENTVNSEIEQNRSLNYANTGITTATPSVDTKGRCVDNTHRQSAQEENTPAVTSDEAIIESPLSRSRSNSESIMSTVDETQTVTSDQAIIESSPSRNRSNSESIMSTVDETQTVTSDQAIIESSPSRNRSNSESIMNTVDETQTVTSDQAIIESSPSRNKSSSESIMGIVDETQAVTSDQAINESSPSRNRSNSESIMSTVDETQAVTSDQAINESSPSRNRSNSESIMSTVDETQTVTSDQAIIESSPSRNRSNSESIMSTVDETQAVTSDQAINESSPSRNRSNSESIMSTVDETQAVTSDQAINESSPSRNRSNSESIMGTVDETDTKVNRMTLAASTASAGDELTSAGPTSQSQRTPVDVDFEVSLEDEAGRDGERANKSPAITDLNLIDAERSERVISSLSSSHAEESQDRVTKKRAETTTAVQRKARSDRALVRSLLVISISLFVLYTPFDITLILSLFLEDPVPVELSTAAALLLFANCANNWIIYGVMNTMFRDAYISVLKGLCCCGSR